MRRVALVILFLLAASGAKATILPAGLTLNGGRQCVSYIEQVSTASGTVQCDMNNVVSGDTILVFVNLVTATTFTVSATETLTCPSQLLVTHNFAGFVHDNFICHVVLASNHSDFNITITVTSGAASREGMLNAYEFKGLGAIDSGSRTTGDLSSSVSVTTAGANEVLFTMGTDLCVSISPAGSNNHYDDLGIISPSGNDYKGIYMVQNTGAAGSYTANWTAAGGGAGTAPFTVAVAFAVAGGATNPAVYVDQMSHKIGATASGATGGTLNNVVNGDKIITSAKLQTANSPPIGGCALTSGEACSCPTGAQANLTVVDNFAQGLCAVDITSSHSTTTVTITPNPVGAAFDALVSYVIKGGLPGIDSGASASATATTSVNYTTATANEWTFCLAGDAKATYPMAIAVPGSSFSPLGNNYADFQNLRYSETLDMLKLTPSSGSNTCSFTLSGSIAPMLSTISFSAPSTAVKSKSYIF